MSEIVKRPWGRFVLPSLLLLLALCLVFIPTLGSDKTDGAEINTYFEYEGNQYKITGETTVWFDRYNGSSDSFTMPDTVQYEGVTYYVTELSGAAFKDNSNTPKEIVTSKYLTTIQIMSFQNSPLEKITLYGQLESIGANAFNGSNLTTVVLAEYVDSIQIGANTFKSKNDVVFEYGKRDFSSQPLLAKITVCSDESLQSPITNISNEEYNSLTNVYFDWEYRYRVDHYVMKDNGVTENMYTDCEYFFGKGWTAAAPREYEGRTELPFSQEIISEDGNTKVKIYYVLDVESLELPDDIVTEYVAGDTFKEFNLIVNHKSDYDGNSDGNPDGITTTVKVTSSMLSGFSTLKSGQYEATVTYAETNVKFTYTVSEKILDLWVGGTQITSENNVLSDGNGGTATYDISKNTLTLNDFDINTEGIGIQSTMTKRIFLVIKGENNIVSGQNGIEAHLLSIDGNGTLNIKSEAAAIFVVGISDHTYIRGSSQTDGLKINIESESHGVYQKFSEGNASDRSMSIVFRYCDIVMSGSGFYGIHGGYGTYLESCTVSIIGYTTGIYSGGATAQGTHLGIEDSSLYIECSVGFDGFHCNPVFTNSVIDVVCNKGFDVVYWGTITLDGSYLSICYRMYASTSSPDFDLYNDSSLVMGFDHERDSISYNDRLCEGSLKINIHDPEDGTYRYVVSVGKSSDAMALYSRAEFDDMLLSSGNYDSSNTKPSETLIYLTSGNMPYYFELRPMATIFYFQEDLSTIYGEAYSYKGGTVTTPTSSDITVPVGNELYGWKELSGEFYLPGRTITVTETYMALFAIFEPPTPVGISVIGDSMISIGDTLEDTSLMVRISYNGNVSTDLHITDVLFEVVGFVTSSYVSEDEPSTATVTYGNLSCEFQYSVRKIPQSLSEFYLYDVSLTGPDYERNFTDGYNDETSRFYFGSGDGELSVTITDRGDAEFDYDEETMTISNVTKAGTITLLFTRGADDTYMETSAEYQMTIHKADVKYYLEEYIVLDPASPDVDDSVTVGLFNDDDATVTIEVVEGGTATATVDGNTVSISDRGADGTVVIKVSVSGSPYYMDSSGTCTLTFSKASGDSEDGFVLPNGLVASKGQTTEDVILPEGWAWTESVTFNGSGDVSVSATYTPADPNNYEVYSTELTVSVGKTPSSITLSDTEFVYADGLTIDFDEYVGGDGDGTLTYSVGEKTGVEFDFEDGVVSNISVAGGSFELIVTKSSTEEYAAKTETFVITLDKGVQSIVVSGGSQSLTFLEPYGVTVTGNVGGLTYAVIEGDATFTDNVLTATGAGTVRYTVTASETDLFDSRTEERAVTFFKVDLTVSVDGCSIEYGSQVPGFTVSQTGLIDGHVLSDVVGILTYTCEYEQYGDVGTYAISVSGNVSHDDYDISYVQGELTVSAKAIEVTIVPATSEYGEGPASLTATTDGIVNGDTGVYGLSTIVTSASAVGTYDIVGEVLDDNYVITFLGGTGAYSVTKATVDAPVIESKGYTGQTLIADVPESDMYSVVSNAGGIEKGTYYVTLRLNDAVNTQWNGHADAEIELEFHIVTSVNSWTVAPSIFGWTYGQDANSPSFESAYGEGVVEYRSIDGTDADYSSVIPEDAGVYLMRVSVDATEDYGGLIDVVEFTIAQATPEYTVPQNIVVMYGETLADADLPAADNGMWSWQDPLTTSVGVVGTRSFGATFTPTDDNYRIVRDVNVSITVGKAPGNLESGYALPTDLVAHVGDGTEDVELLGSWEFVSAVRFDTSGDVQVEIRYVPSDQTNYDDHAVSVSVTVSGHSWSSEWLHKVAEGHAHVCTVDGCDALDSLDQHVPSVAATETDPQTCTVCGYVIVEALGHTHSADTVWEYDESHHWHDCIANDGQEFEKSQHVFDDDCDTDCDCGYVRTVEHDFTGEWIKDATHHWHVCETEGCEVTDTKAEHSHDDVCDIDCNTCGQTRTVPHDFTGEWIKDATHHWHICEIEGCEVTDTKAEHVYDHACDVDCNTCGQTMAVSHDFTGDWTRDATHHWHICATNGCEVTDTKVGHSYDNACDSDCNACGYTRVITHDFTGGWIKDATHHWHICETEGCEITDSKIEHSYDGVCDVDCNTCGYIRTVTHDFTGEWIKDATHHWHICATNGCEVTDTKVGHSYDNACDSDCNACGYTRVITHDFTGGWIKDSTHHWHICATNGCEVTDTKVGHDFVDGCDEDCGVCGHERVAPHTASDEWSHGDHYHWKDCTACTGQVGLDEHQYEGDSTLCNICDHDWSIHHNYTVLHKDASGHWYECSHALCVEASSLEVHVAGTPDHLTGQVLCVDCGYEMQAASQTPDQTPEGPSDEDDGGISIGIVAGGVAGVLALAGVGAFLFLRGRP